MVCRLLSGIPSQLADRICGHPDWNRHVKYKAIKRGYISVYRVQYRQRVIRSLRLTSFGALSILHRGIRERCPMSWPSRTSGAGSRNVAERILRYHAQAIALIMARNAGAIFYQIRSQVCWPIRWPPQLHMIQNNTTSFPRRSYGKRSRSVETERIPI